MIDLLVATTNATLPSLAPVLERFLRLGRLTLLLQAPSSIPPSLNGVPIISSVDEFAGSASLTLLIASPSISSEVCSKFSTIVPVYERSLNLDTDSCDAVIVDNYEQLCLLSDLSGFPGFSQLINSFEWTPEDFKNKVLKNYSLAIDMINLKQQAVVFGAQRLGELVFESLKLSDISTIAFLDNNEQKHGTCVCGVNVLPLSAIEDKTLPIIIATTRFTSSICRQLKQAGYENVLPYSVMSLLQPDKYPDEIPYLGIQDDLSQNVAAYIGLFLTLADEKSRRVLDGLLQYRQEYDSTIADSVSDEYDRQYFDDELVQFSKEDVFVDLGGFDGDTVEKFIEFSGESYSKIYLFEPDSSLLVRAKERLKSYKNIEFVDAGAYSKDGDLRFATTGRTNGSFSEEGEIVIPVKKLDSVVREKPTLIKMDIEGAETDALRGGEDVLRNAKPTLAIAAYHFSNDLWRLVDVVHGINPAYRFYLRHYSETGLESVIYAI